MKKRNSSFCLRALALLGLMIFMMAGMSVSAHAAANASITPGYYVIQSGNSTQSAQRALDVSGASMSNGANVILYTKNTASTNQIFYVKKESNGYYTFRAVHSGSYLHKYNTSNNVVQWNGLSNNAYWQIQIAGNGYYYIRHRNGLNLDNSGGRTTLGNNVWLFLPNGTNAQKWKLVPVSRPSLSLSLSNVKNPSGTYNNPTTVTASGTISSNYPITKIRYGIYDSKGNAKTTTTKYPNAKSFTYGFKINVSTYPAGQYFFGIDVMNVGKEQKKSSRYYFTITRPVTVSKAKQSAGEKLAKMAESEIGYQGRNSKGTGKGDYTKYGKWIGVDGDKWCASFVSWCVSKAGISTAIVPKTASTLTMGQKSKSYNRWTSSTFSKIKRGDVILFSTVNSLTYSKGGKAVHHVGIVTRVDSKAHKLEVVEGNTGTDIVARRTYTVNASSGKITASLGGAWNGEYFCGFISVK